MVKFLYLKFSPLESLYKTLHRIEYNTLDFCIYNGVAGKINVGLQIKSCFFFCHSGMRIVLWCGWINLSRDFKD